MPDSFFDTILFDEGTFGGGSLGVPCGVEVGKFILYPALRKAGVTLGPQRTPSDAQYQDAIDELNRLISSLSCDRLFIYSLTEYSFPLTDGKTSYTIGVPCNGDTTVDFAVPRPLMIAKANLTNASGACSHLRVTSEPVCDSCGSGGTLYNNRAVPVSTLRLPAPVSAGVSLQIFVWQTTSRVSSPGDAIDMPEGYEDALVLNLALRLAPQFQRRIDPALRLDARESLMRIQSINAPQPVASLDNWGSCCADNGTMAPGGSNGNGSGSAPVVGPPGPQGPQGIQGPPGPAGAAGLPNVIQDDGLALTPRTTLNFAGAGVTATDDGTRTVVTIPGGGSGHAIQDEGTPLAARTGLNFVGAGVAVTDDAGNNRSVVTIPGGPVGLERPLSDFGAVGDGVTDDTAAVQAAFTWAMNSPNLAVFEGVGYGRAIVGNSGKYKITSTIVIQHVMGLSFRATHACCFIWYGNATSPMFWLKNCNNCHLSGFQIIGAPGSTFLLEGVRISGMGLPGFTSTQNRFQDIFMIHAAGGIGTCFRDGGPGSVNGNNDFMMFENCYLCNYSVAAFTIENTQAFSWVMYNCQAVGFGVGKYAISGGDGIPCKSTFQWHDGFVGGHTVADFYIEPPSGPASHFYIGNLSSESSNRFLLTAPPNSLWCRIILDNVRYANLGSPGLNADGVAVHISHGGPILMRNCQFGEPQGSDSTTIPLSIIWDVQAPTAPNMGSFPYMALQGCTFYTTLTTLAAIIKDSVGDPRSPAAVLSVEGCVAARYNATTGQLFYDKIDTSGGQTPWGSHIDGGGFNLSNTGDIGFGPTARTAVVSVPTDGASDSGAMVFSTKRLGTLAERMRLTSDGNLGIGLGNPSVKLQVQGDALVSGQMWLNTCTISAYLSVPQILGIQQVLVERSTGTVYYDTAGVLLKGPANADPLIRPPRIAFTLNDSSVFAQIGMDVNGMLRTYSGFQQAATGFAPFQCGVLVANSLNYIASETGANNALVASLANVTLAAGLEVRVKLAHTLQAGANTLNLNGSGALAIKSHKNPTSNIAAAYTVGCIVDLIYDGTQWQDLAQ